jgi:DNA polymerase III sliding clamp (beta) subunit (PCNA family)
MLKDLKFVQGAVAKKDLVPAMKHFCIEQGTIRSYNGKLAISSPIQFDIDCKPNATELVQAIANCNADHTVTITMSDDRRYLRILNGPYDVKVNCIEEETPHVLPEGNEISLAGISLRDAFDAVLSFAGNDASRDWANGILLSGQSMFATNNVIVVEYWLGTQLPFTANVPNEAIEEVIRVGEDPTHIQLNDYSITFHFDNGKWIRSGLYDMGRLNEIPRILNRDPLNIPMSIDKEFFEGIKKIKPFLNKQREVYFRDGHLTNHYSPEGSTADYALDNFEYAKGCYTVDNLLLLENVAETIDWTEYPNACMFYGGKLRGAIIGRKMPGNV